MVPGLGIEPRTRGFSIPALPTELSGQRGALNRISTKSSMSFSYKGDQLLSFQTMNVKAI